MLGEDQLSESPRVPSPWDPFLPSPPSEAGSLESRKQLRNGIPKLVPEVEEGNVEYKLKLTHITPARFARLVTQMKWRLLEGSGQAYYELGVADSGALIGLSRADLEQSLETLEMMAGEIGASVIVVKEIEVPPAMVALADKVSAYIDPETGEWTEKMCNRRRKVSPRDTDSDSATPPYGIDTETDTTDTDEPSSLVSTPNFPPVTSHVAYSHRLAPSNPNASSGQASPAIFPIDDDLALFSMEPEPSFDNEDGDDVEDSAPDVLADVPELALDIEITPVYKPRPVRRRDPLNAGQGEVGRPARRLAKNKHKKPQAWHDSAESEVVQNKQEAKALLRRIARDKRREAKRNASTTVSGSVQVASEAADSEEVVVAGLESLHAGVQSAAAVVTAAEDQARPSSTPAPGVESKEPRLIVEAFVVRKMSLEEGYLDFMNLGSLSLV